MIELTEVRRQEKEWERAALDSLRSGRVPQSVSAYVERDRMTFGTTAEAVRAKLVSDWWEAWDEGPSVMLASRRDDVDDLNARARLLMRETGQLGEDDLEVARRSFAIGDRVMTTCNARRLGVLNGTQGEVAAIDASKRELTIRTDGKATCHAANLLRRGRPSHPRLRHDRSQGPGYRDGALLRMGDDTLYKEWGYTVLSREKTENRLYLVGGHDAGREEVGGAVSYEADGKVRAIRALARSKSKEFASDRSLAAIRTLGR